MKFNEDDMYKSRTERDGVDTSKAGSGGWQKNLLQDQNCYDDWRDSRTGERTEKPEWAKDKD